MTKVLKRFRLPLTIGMTLIVVSEIAIRVMGHSFLNVAANQPKFSVNEIATQVGRWTGTNREIDLNLFRSTGADELIGRKYENNVGDKIEMHAGCWLNYDVAIPHKAEICYPAAGWEIVSREVVEIPVADQNSFSAKLLYFDQHDQRIAVMYWVKFGEQTALDDEDVRRTLQQTVSVGKPRPAAIKIMLQIDGKNGDAAKRTLVDFAGQIAPLLKPFEEH